MKIRVNLYNKSAPKADQKANKVTIDVPDGARNFDYAGLSYKMVGVQGSVAHEDRSGVLEADAVEI